MSQLDNANNESTETTSQEASVNIDEENNLEEEQREELFSYLGDNVQDDNPEIASYNYTLTEDDPQNSLQGNVLDGSAEGDGEHIFTWVDTNATYGSLQVDEDGNFTYVLNNSLDNVQALSKGESVQEEFFYSYTDADGDASIGSLVITINGTNDAPIVEKAKAEVIEDTSPSISGQLEAKDIDNNDSISFAVANPTGIYGTIVVNTDGSYSYTLNNSLDAVQGLTDGEKLEESFSYTVYDKEGESSTSEVIVSIKGTNDSPSIEPLEISVKEDDLTFISGSLNPIIDPDNELDGIISENTYYLAIENTYGMYGNFTLNEDGTYTYTLNNNLDIVQNLNNGEYLTETFSYVVYDEKGGQTTSTITIKIEGKDEGSCGGGGGNGSAEHVQLHVVEDTINSASTKLSSMETEEMIEEDEVGFYIFGADESITQIAGSLVDVEDIDSEKAHYVTQENTQTEYGVFSLAEDGQYTYIIDNLNPKITDLNIGEKIQDEIIIQAIDDKGDISESTFTMNIEGTSDSPSGYSEDYINLIGDYNLGGVLSSSNEHLDDFFDIAENTTKTTDYSHVIDYSSTDTALNTEATIQSELMKMG